MANKKRTSHHRTNIFAAFRKQEVKVYFYEDEGKGHQVPVKTYNSRKYEKYIFIGREFVKIRKIDYLRTLKEYYVTENAIVFVRRGNDFYEIKQTKSKIKDKLLGAFFDIIKPKCKVRTERKFIYSHKLMCAVWNGYRNTDYWQVTFKDGNTDNLSPENLQWRRRSKIRNLKVFDFLTEEEFKKWDAKLDSVTDRDEFNNKLKQDCQKNYCKLIKNKEFRNKFFEEKFKI